MHSLYFFICTPLSSSLSFRIHRVDHERPPISDPPKIDVCRFQSTVGIAITPSVATTTCKRNVPRLPSLHLLLHRIAGHCYIHSRPSRRRRGGCVCFVAVVSLRLTACWHHVECVCLPNMMWHSTTGSDDDESTFVATIISRRNCVRKWEWWREGDVGWSYIQSTNVDGIIIGFRAMKLTTRPGIFTCPSHPNHPLARRLEFQIA